MEVSSANRPLSSFPRVAHTRMRTPSRVRSSTLAKSPTMNARRYVDMTGVSANRTDFFPAAPTLTETGSVLEIASNSAGTMSVTSNDALTAGSSQHGNARRASVDSNCVVANHRRSPSGSA